MDIRTYLVTAVALFGMTVCSAQEPGQTAPIKGKPILTVFADYKAGLGNANDVSGFNLNRAFAGYEVSLPKGFSAKVVLNVETNAFPFSPENERVSRADGKGDACRAGCSSRLQE